LLDAPRLLFDLQQVNQIAQTFSGCLVPEKIAVCVTTALVDRFGCVFARLWLLEPDRAHLRLVSSSGLYTHIDGAFARVPMGAYKVGKIAQNQVPFLSNQLAEEPWVKDRDWAIANGIQGFAGYPLVSGDRTIGVLAAFSTHILAPEFLEVLQVLCMTATVALDGALQVQRDRPTPAISPPGINASLPLSDQLTGIMPNTQLTLVGTERPLPMALTCAMVHTAEQLHQLHCNYCRLTYSDYQVSLEAIAAPPTIQTGDGTPSFPPLLSALRPMVQALGGRLQVRPGPPGSMVQVWIDLPYPPLADAPRIGVRCQSAPLQAAVIHLAYQAGIAVVSEGTPTAIGLTDDPEGLAIAPMTLWVRRPGGPVPPGVEAVVNLDMTPEQFRDLVQQCLSPSAGGGTAQHRPQLSSREREVMTLLAEGWRDRSIAAKLHISESTVKFHINNSLTKLNAKNRYQGVYQAAIQGCI
jgi:DNA-binding CsgD family transcriptional regulator